jgi:membrane protease YdiL (CAAX protease family)
MNLIRKYPLPAFFLLAIGLTWPFLIADALGSRGIIPFRMPASGPGILLSILMAYCPTIAAVIVLGMTEGKAGIRRLFSRFLIWRVGLRWYLITIFGVALLYFAALRMDIWLGGTATATAPGGLPMLVVSAVVMFLVNGLVNGEEFGWRGFALPRLQSRYNALTSSLFLGAVWILFHLPLFFTKGGGVGGNMSHTPFLAFAINVLAGSVLMTWIFNNTRGSVLFAYLFHAASNTWPGIFASADSDGSIFWTQAIVLVIAAVIVVISTGAENLSRTTARAQEQ